MNIYGSTTPTPPPGLIPDYKPLPLLFLFFTIGYCLDKFYTHLKDSSVTSLPKTYKFCHISVISKHLYPQDIMTTNLLYNVLGCEKVMCTEIWIHQINWLGPFWVCISASAICTYHFYMAATYRTFETALVCISAASLQPTPCSWGILTSCQHYLSGEGILAK